MKPEHHMRQRLFLNRWARRLDNWAAALRKREKSLRPKRPRKTVNA